MTKDEAIKEYFKELEKALEQLPEEVKRIPRAELMARNLKMMNAQLDYILSGEWRKDHGADSERHDREENEGDTLQQ